MEQIDLTGVYPGGEGAILQVQRFENGTWTDFPASPVSVSDQTFSTYVQTGQPGVQRFRMRRHRQRQAPPTRSRSPSADQPARVVRRLRSSAAVQ